MLHLFGCPILQFTVDCTAPGMNVLSLRQLSFRLSPAARHLCRVCRARHLSSAAPQAPALRAHRLARHAAPLSGGSSRFTWHRCRSRATDAAVDAGDAAGQHLAAATAANAAAPAKGLSFQDAIARLQAYWSSKGCAVCLPHNTEVKPEQQMLCGVLSMLVSTCTNACTKSQLEILLRHRWERAP